MLYTLLYILCNYCVTAPLVEERNIENGVLKMQKYHIEPFIILSQ